MRGAATRGPADAEAGEAAVRRASRPRSGKTIKLHGLQFTVIGAFQESGPRASGCRNSPANNVLIPITVLQVFRAIERIDPLYVQARNAGRCGADDERGEDRFWKAGIAPARATAWTNLAAILDGGASASRRC